MSTKAKMETAAERYRRIKAETEKNEPLHDVECVCGMTWKCRRVSIDFWVTSGVLPSHLVATMVKATEKAGAKPEDIIKSMAANEILQSIEFSSRVVKHTAVDPRIVETVEGPNDIAQSDTMTCCYNRLLNWQMSGGDEGPGLEKFRTK